MHLIHEFSVFFCLDFLYENKTKKSFWYLGSETLAETIESDPTDLFQNKSVAYFLVLITFL